VLYVPSRGLDRALDAQIAVSHRGEASELLGGFIRRLDRLDPARPPSANLLATALGLIDLTWPPAPPPPARASAAAWRERLHRHVEQHLGDPDLDAARLAAHFGISARYVQMIFARDGSSLTQTLLELRLQTVAERLRREPLRPIGDIALEAGFGDLSHFCRRFRERFGVNARAYRSGYRPA
jgi:AraC-like DNA-binding protein